jgi:cytochrome c2
LASGASVSDCFCNHSYCLLRRDSAHHPLFYHNPTVIADEAYLRESIVNPNKQIVAGYPPTMPPYGYLKEEQINQLIAYIKSLKDEKPEFVKH